MTANSISNSAKLPPKSPNEDTQGDELPEINVDDRRAPLITMGNSRQSGDGVTDADPESGRADAKDRIPAHQTANRE